MEDVKDKGDHSVCRDHPLLSRSFSPINTIENVHEQTEE